MTAALDNAIQSPLFVLYFEPRGAFKLSTEQLEEMFAEGGRLK
jgi:hypothetical protein